MKQALPTLPAPTDAEIGNSREFLELLAHILVHMGHSPKKLTAEFDEICDGLPEPARAWNPSYLSFLTAPPGVIARWHTDEQLDASPAFHRWLKKQANEFLWGVYRNMARHEPQASSRPSTRLSVAVFAFEDAMITGTPTANQEARSGMRRPSTGGRRRAVKVGKP